MAHKKVPVTQAEINALALREVEQAEKLIEQREQALQKLQRMEDALIAAIDVELDSGTNVPHTAEFVERIFNAFGGVDAVSKLMAHDYFANAPGSSKRIQIHGMILKLVMKNTDQGGVKKPIEFWSDEELEQALDKRIRESVRALPSLEPDVQRSATA